MQSVSSKIWTRVAVSISYDDNHYTTGTIYVLQSVQIYLSILYYMDVNYGKESDSMEENWKTK